MSSKHLEPGSEPPILTLATSSRALFDLEESNRIFDEKGLGAYLDYQTRHEQVTLEPGEALQLRAQNTLTQR